MNNPSVDPVVKIKIVIQWRKRRDEESCEESDDSVTSCFVNVPCPRNKKARRECAVTWRLRPAHTQQDGGQQSRIGGTPSSTCRLLCLMKYLSAPFLGPEGPLELPRQSIELMKTSGGCESKWRFQSVDAHHDPNFGCGSPARCSLKCFERFPPWRIRSGANDDGWCAQLLYSWWIMLDSPEMAALCQKAAESDARASFCRWMQICLSAAKSLLFVVVNAQCGA